MKTFKQLTKRFNYVNPDIEKNFSLEKREHKGYKLFHFEKFISSENAIKEIEKEGYLPANLKELLDWKKWNEKDWVVALGSVGEVCGCRFVPYLYGGVSGRSLSLRCWVGDWDADFRFLAVRNLSLSVSEPQESALERSDTLSLEVRVTELERKM